MNEDKLIGDYGLCCTCRKIIPKGKCTCSACDKQSAALMEKFLKNLRSDSDIRKAVRKLLQPNNGIERAIKRLK